MRKSALMMLGKKEVVLIVVSSSEYSHLPFSPLFTVHFGDEAEPNANAENGAAADGVTFSSSSSSSDSSSSSSSSDSSSSASISSFSPASSSGDQESVAAKAKPKPQFQFPLSTTIGPRLSTSLPSASQPAIPSPLTNRSVSSARPEPSFSFMTVNSLGNLISVDSRFITIFGLKYCDFFSVCPHDFFVFALFVVFSEILRSSIILSPLSFPSCALMILRRIVASRPFLLPHPVHEHNMVFPHCH